MRIFLPIDGSAASQLAQTYPPLGVNSARICDAAACNDKNAIYELIILIFTRMKKSLFMIFAAMAALFMVSCEPEDTVEVPTVSFAVQPVNVDGVFTLTLMTSGYDGTEPVTVPLDFSGSAVEFEDYRLSAEAFVIGGAEPVNTITVTTLTTVPDKELTISLTAPEGFVLGKIPSVTLSLTPVKIYLSFESNAVSAPEAATAVLNTYDGQGALKRVGQAMTFEVEVNTEKSTAELGNHFVFDSDEPEGNIQKVVVEANDLEGALTINLVKYEEGHNTVVLNIKETENSPTENSPIGEYGEVAITFSGSLWTKLGGTWVINEFVTDREYQESYYDGWGMSGFDLFPTVSSNDKITFDLSANTFTPSFEDGFNDYFLGVSNITEGYYYNKETSGNFFNDEVLLVELDNVNRYFDPANPSEEKHAYIGVKFITDDNGEELLDLYILDYESHTFLPELIDMDMYNSTRPTAPLVYLEMTFKRAE